MKIESQPHSLAIDPRISAVIDSNQQPGSRLEASAEQFEAIFLQMVLKNMHSATEAIAADDSPLNSNSFQTYQSMHDAQLSQLLATQRELGLAESIVKQLGSELQENEKRLKPLTETVASMDQAQVSSASIGQSNRSFEQPLWADRQRRD